MKWRWSKPDRQIKFNAYLRYNRTFMTFTSKLEFQPYLKLMFYLTFRRPIMLLFLIIGGVFILNALFQFTPGSQQTSVGLMVGIVMPIYLVTAVYWRTRKIFQTNKRLSERMTYELDSERIRVSGETFASEMDWSGVHKIEELRHWFLIYSSGQTANLVPKSALGGQEEILIDLLKKTGVKRKLKKR